VQVTLERVNSHVELSVSDSGRGIPPEFLPYVFEKFSQADSTLTRSNTGLGLGLAIVKNLTELHGGTVRAKSAGEGKGATFIISLPVSIVRTLEGDEHRQHPGTAREIEFPADPDLSGVRVLVVDDDTDALQLVKHVLGRCNASVTTCSSAAECLAALPAVNPNVLLTDIGMREVDGYSLIRRLRALPPDEGGDTPAAALTAFARSEDRRRALLAGFDMHVAKPVEPGELVAVVARLARRR
jgi:CheY-like chemotaxis protein